MKLIKKIGGFLCSMKFAIILLIILVFACTAGSLIPQGEVMSFYTSGYSEKVAGAILLFGFNDVFVSIDSNSCMVKMMYPMHDDIYPISYEGFVQNVFPDLSQEDKNKILSFLFKKNKTKNVNITIKKKWYSLEYRLIQGEEIIHIFYVFI